MNAMNTEMQTAIAAAVALALANAKPVRKAKAAKGAAKGREKLTDEQKAVNAKVNADVAVKLFQDAGYENCVAHDTIRTYDKWIEVGYRVKKGQKALRTPKGMALFHLSQCDRIAPAN